jgi:hypothetical protein
MLLVAWGARLTGVTNGIFRDEEHTLYENLVLRKTRGQLAGFL